MPNRLSYSQQAATIITLQHKLDRSSNFRVKYGKRIHVYFVISSTSFIFFCLFFMYDHPHNHTTVSQDPPPSALHIDNKHKPQKFHQVQKKGQKQILSYLTVYRFEYNQIMSLPHFKRQQLLENHPLKLQGNTIC